MLMCLKVEFFFYSLDSGWRHPCNLGCVPDRLASLQVLQDRLVLCCQLILSLFACSLGLPQFASIPDILIPSTFQPVINGLPSSSAAVPRTAHIMVR